MFERKIFWNEQNCSSTSPQRRFILADHEKFGLISTVKFADIGDAIIVTDAKPAEKYANSLKLILPEQADEPK